eukprot:750430-Hanusia_phi.AAC.2
MAEPTGTISVFPRRKKGEDNAEVKDPVELTYELVASFFEMKQEDAAQQLGLSLTSFKGACRRLGVTRWPYNRKYTSKHDDKQSHSSSGIEEAQEPFHDDSHDEDAAFLVPAANQGAARNTNARQDFNAAAAASFPKTRSRKGRHDQDQLVSLTKNLESMGDVKDGEIVVNELGDEQEDGTDAVSRCKISQLVKSREVEISDEVYMGKTLFDEAIEHVEGKSSARLENSDEVKQ